MSYTLKQTFFFTKSKFIKNSSKNKSELLLLSSHIARIGPVQMPGTLTAHHCSQPRSFSNTFDRISRHVRVGKASRSNWYLTDIGVKVIVNVFKAPTL